MSFYNVVGFEMLIYSLPPTLKSALIPVQYKRITKILGQEKSLVKNSTSD
jgi:hypothetical protein